MKGKKVVQAHHAGACEGETLVPGALRQRLDASFRELTGLNDAREAWAALFAPDERIAIKVNAFRNSVIWTHVPLVAAVSDALQEAGFPACAATARIGTVRGVGRCGARGSS